MRSRLVAVEVPHGFRFDTFAGTALLKCTKITISRAAPIKNERGRHSRVLALYDISVTFLARTATTRGADCDVFAEW